MRRGWGGAKHGQALVIFALSIAALFLLVGLSIDGLRVYIAFGQAERAAEAAALAGVNYLPQYPTSATKAPDGNDATDRAWQAAAQNGFTDQSVITVTPQTGTAPVLRVAIHLNLPLSLIALLHPGPVTTDAIAAAQLLPPVTLGDGSNSFGDQTENMTQQVAGLTSPNELKERGDPYSTLCELGWSEASDQSHINATSNIYYTSQLHVPTNKLQYASGPNCSPGNPGNPDQIPTGFGGLATRASPVPSGASYLITIPQGGTGYSVWVWNPRFVYHGLNVNNTLFTQENIYTNSFTDNPAFYPQMAYSLFTVPQLYKRAADVPFAAIWPNATAPNVAPAASLAASQIVSLPSLDANSHDLQIHGCQAAWNLQGGSTYSGVIYYGAGCLNAVPADDGNWVQVGAATLSAGTSGPAYARLTADTNVGYGQHAYAVKVCHNATSATNCAADGATVGAWNFETVILRGGQSQSYPLANIPAAYAGRQLSLNLYNPGPGTGTITLRIVPPTGGGTVTYPSYVRLTGSPAAIQTSNNGDSLYHGKWVRLTITLPPDYTGGQWQLAWNSATTAPNNLMTVGLTLNGPAVSLIPTA